MHYAIVLATWFKLRLKDSIYQQLYIDKKKMAGIDTSDPQAQEKIYLRSVCSLFVAGTPGMVVSTLMCYGAHYCKSRLLSHQPKIGQCTPKRKLDFY
jgi:hypothetical protein